MGRISTGVDKPVENYNSVIRKVFSFNANGWPG